MPWFKVDDQYHSHPKAETQEPVPAPPEKVPA